jgi:hypothetical protein
VRYTSGALMASGSDRDDLGMRTGSDEATTDRAVPDEYLRRFGDEALLVVWNCLNYAALCHVSLP